MIQSTDFVYVLSGGSNNTVPTLSLGGDPSSTPVPNGLNNLFNNVSATQSAAGRIDYSCFYIFNDNLTDALYNCTIYSVDTPGGSTTELGFVFSNEIQNVTVVGNVTGGSLTLSYDSHNFTFAYNSSLAVWAANFQTALQGIIGAGNATVTARTAVSSIPTTIFTVNFVGSQSNRFQSVLTVQTNALTPTPVVSTARINSGSPINSIATLINVTTTPPTGVSFYTSNSSEPILIGVVQPTDGFPVWIKRNTPAGAQPVASDTVEVVFDGTVYP